MDTQEELGMGIGTEEAERLKPAKVSIVEVRIEAVGTKGAKKVQCDCKHPQKEETIQISAVKYENKGKLESVGLWVNKNKENGVEKLRKGSTLVFFLNSVGAKSIAELKGKEVETTTDEQGYLTFKAY